MLKSESQQLNSANEQFKKEKQDLERDIKEQKERRTASEVALKVVHERRSQERNETQSIVETREAWVRAVSELLGMVGVARSHLRQLFVSDSWRRSVDGGAIPDELGAQLCAVVEDVQWLQERGYTITSTLFTEVERRAVGMSTSRSTVTPQAPPYLEGSSSISSPVVSRLSRSIIDIV